MKNITPITVYVSHQTKERLHSLATRDQRSLSREVAYIVELYLRLMEFDQINFSNLQENVNESRTTV